MRKLCQSWKDGWKKEVKENPLKNLVLMVRASQHIDFQRTRGFRD